MRILFSNSFIRYTTNILPSLPLIVSQAYSYESKLIEFCDRLMLTSLRDAAPLFQVSSSLIKLLFMIFPFVIQALVKLYTPYLSYDPVVLSLLKGWLVFISILSLNSIGPISKNIFNIESPPNMMSMIQNLLSLS